MDERETVKKAVKHFQDENDSQQFTGNLAVNCKDGDDNGVELLENGENNPRTTGKLSSTHPKPVKKKNPRKKQSPPKQTIETTQIYDAIEFRRGPNKGHIDWEMVKKEYLRRKTECQIKGITFTNSGFCKTHSIHLGEFTTRKNREKWVEQYDESLMTRVDEVLNNTAATHSRVILDTTLENGTDLEKECNILTMDNKRMFDLLSDDAADLTSRQYWQKLGITEYSHTLAKLFSAVGRGLSLDRAIRYSSISKTEYKELCANIPILSELYQEAVSNFEMAQLAKIEAAGQKDWRSAAYLLETHPDTRERYKPRDEKPEINIVITVDRMNAAVENNQKVVDISDAEIVEVNDITD